MINLYNMDCMEAMAGMKDKEYDLAIVDPPYFLPARHYATRKNFKRNFSDIGLVEFFFRDYFIQLSRILKPTGSFYIFCDGQSYPIFYYHSYFFCKNVKPIIWDKTVSINGYGWRHQHEIIMWGEMPEAKPIPTGDGDIIKEKAVPIDTRIHPAEKPVELLKKLISKSAKPGYRILDTHGGSMSIAIACHDLGFDLDLYEIDADYFKAGSERLKRHQAQMRMF